MAVFFFMSKVQICLIKNAIKIFSLEEGHVERLELNIGHK